MSYKYGLNGNDINWDFLDNANMRCCDCKQREEDICEGHTLKYSRKGWAVYHDTNDNFVRVSGNVPLGLYTTNYLLDWFSDIYTNEKVLQKIFKELKIRNEIPKVIGGWGISNVASLNVYLLHETNVDYTVFVGVNDEIPKLVKVQEEFAEEVRNYIVFGKSKYYLDECIKY